jgi:hypothetical protein
MRHPPSPARRDSPLEVRQPLAALKGWAKRNCHE